MDEWTLVNTLAIGPGLDIPLSEIDFRYSRSSGPGGQHVNKSATRVELLFDLESSPSVSDELRPKLLSRLAPYLDGSGVLHLVSQSSRSQWRNREDLLERFRVVLARALVERPLRRPTRPGRAARERRLEAKRRRSEIKRSARARGIEKTLCREA